MGDESNPPTLAIVNASSRYTGTTQCALSFAEALESAGFGVSWYQCVDEGKEPELVRGLKLVSGARLSFEPLEMGLNRLWLFGKRAGRFPEDLVLLTDPTLTFIGRRHRARIVLVHDLIPLSEFADRLDQSLMFVSLLPTLRRVGRILVPTTTVRDELLRYGIDSTRIRVVAYTHSLGIHPDHIARSVDRVRQSGRLRVLYVATDRPRKNFDFILQLAKTLQESPEGRKITFTLRTTLRRTTAEHLSRLGLTNVQVVKDVPSMAYLYNEHDVLVYPSQKEGFGLPLIEALAFGIPIVANKIPPFSEILGEAGTFLSVDSPTSWADELTSLLDPAKLQAQAERSLRASFEFTPERFRGRLVAAIRDLLPPGRELSAPG